MSRQLRRHPVASQPKRQRPVRPAVARPAPQRRQRSGGGEGRGALGLLRPKWAEEIVSELRKVTWPSREETQYLTIVVIVVATFFGILLGGIDMFFNWAIDNTILR